MQSQPRCVLYKHYECVLTIYVLLMGVRVLSPLNLWLSEHYITPHCWSQLGATLPPCGRCGRCILLRHTPAVLIQHLAK